MVVYDADNRPDPDELLASLKQEEEKSKRGKLKIFFGMCAGVGKTYTMLQTAHAERQKGADIVIGYIETHNRKETTDLVEGFEIISRKIYEYKSTPVQEMDLDAVVARKPQIVLVDELAHTNAPGSRHSKRFQDVQEILDNGIDVYTTVNVQHLESRADTVAQITGIIIRETLPDEIFEKADEVELVDLTPEELLQRLSDGKVYTPERSQEAVANFFRKGNITALREMSLRLVADRVDRQLKDYMQQKRIRGPWKSGLHLMVIIGPSVQSTKLLRWAKSISYTMGASLAALYVQSPHKLTDAQNEQLSKNINLARQLGADVITTSGTDLVKAVLNVAHKENITHIIVGKPRYRNIFSMLVLRNFIHRLIRYSGNIDVYVLGSDRKEDNEYFRYISFPSFSSRWRQYALASLSTISVVFAFYPFTDQIGYQVVSYVLLFLVSILAIFMGIGPILLAATLSALIWNYFFIPPRFTFHINRAEDGLMFIMFFIIALVNGVLTSRVRNQERLSRDREERTNSLFALSKQLSVTSGINEVIRVSTKAIKKYFKVDCAFILQGGNNELLNFKDQHKEIKLTQTEWSVASWAFRHISKAGRFTETLPASEFTFYPLVGNRINPGVILAKLNRKFSGEDEIYWETFRSQIAGALEREFLEELAHKAEVLDESDRLYKTLFNSISHELRIPVTTILGATDTLLFHDYPEETRKELYSEINKASERLNRLIENLLNMSRLESGHITPRLDWCDVNDLANKVTSSLDSELGPFNLFVIIPPEMPLVKIDFGLMEQVLYNLLINAVQHAPAGSNLRIKIYYDNGFLYIQVMDRGPGFPPMELPYVFNKFYRGGDAKAGGTGLGLSIVKGFVEAHNGTVTAENRTNGGARFSIKIPSENEQLTIDNVQ
jgi:two-component system, OmpR family, sensor histidine kinase KdpD